jgi:hypothetical protein
VLVLSRRLGTEPSAIHKETSRIAIMSIVR